MQAVKLRHTQNRAVFLILVVLATAFLVVTVSVWFTLCRPNVQPAADWDSRIVAATAWRDDVRRLYADGCAFLRFEPVDVVCNEPERTLPLISRMESVRNVLFVGQRFGDNSSLLANLPRLEGLWIRQCEIAHGALWCLGEIESLRHLTLASSRVCDEDLKHILSATRLVSLDLSYNAEITETGLDTYPNAALLRTLNLNNTGVRHLAFARHLTELQELELSATQIADSDLSDLVGLRQLAQLDVSATSISDEGIQFIGQVKTLCCLNINYTKITPHGLQLLRQALPETTIYHSGTVQD